MGATGHGQSINDERRKNKIQKYTQAHKVDQHSRGCTWERGEIGETGITKGTTFTNGVSVLMRGQRPGGFASRKLENNFIELECAGRAPCVNKGELASITQQGSQRLTDKIRLAGGR